jgi:arylsulfatase A-like enzyme
MSTDPSFTGVIGRTLADSVPAWPSLPEGLGGPNVVMIVLDDTGFAHFGSYGSTLKTPNIDALAAGGLRYTNFHTTALCSPTRACLLTGRNHHAVGMRGVSNWNTGFPHMRGGITPRAATIAELLRSHGYATFAAGKWHLAPMEETSAAGPHTNWPLQKGFDRFYGFLQGETDQFHPELTHDNHHIDPPGRPEDGYHVSEDITSKSMEWVRDLVSVRPDRPFFLYLAYGAMHAPHQAPQSYLDRWKGAFDEGYDVLRQRWYERQVELGVIPAGTTLAPRNPGVPAWDDLTPNQKTFSCRLQEAFAAMLEHTDDQIGRLTAFLAERGLLENTMLMVLSDNGASREGGPFGVMDEFSFFNAMWEDIDQIVAERLDDIGGPHSHSNYPWGWAQAGNSPLRWYKQNTYGGGVRDPLVVHWPAGIARTAGSAIAVLPRRRPRGHRARHHRRAVARNRGGCDATSHARTLHRFHVRRRRRTCGAARAVLRADGPPGHLGGRLEGHHLPRAGQAVRRRRVGPLPPGRGLLGVPRPLRRAPREAAGTGRGMVGTGRRDGRAAARRPHHRAVRRHRPARLPARRVHLRVPASHLARAVRRFPYARGEGLDDHRLGPGARRGRRGRAVRPWQSHNVGHSFFVKDGAVHFDINALGTHFRASHR